LVEQAAREATRWLANLGLTKTVALHVGLGQVPGPVDTRWVGAYPVSGPIAAALQAAADELRDDERDPVEELTAVALDAVSTYRASAAA
jgi:hypothetical protein